MSEEGEKVEISTEPLADVHPVSDCETSIGEGSKMADAQPIQVSERGEESRGNNQETPGLVDDVEKTESSQETNLSDGSEEATRALESDTRAGEIKQAAAEEVSSQPPSSNPNVAGEPQGTSEETPSANPENLQAEASSQSLSSNLDAANDPQGTLDGAPATTPEEPKVEVASQSQPCSSNVANEPQGTSEETPATTPEEPQVEVSSQSQPCSSNVANEPQGTSEETPATTQEELQVEVSSQSQPCSSDVANEHQGTSEDTPATTQEEPQAAAQEENAAVTPMKTESTTPEENHADNQDESSASTEQTASAVPETVEKETSEKSLTDASADQKISENHQTAPEKSNSLKRAPPKVLPKPKYEPPEIKVDLFVKAHASFPNKLGDCPFCHRIMMTLKLKKIGGTVCPVNLNVKSREFEDFCARHGLPTKVPIIQHGETVMCDSNAIADYLDKIRPVPKLACLSKATNAAGDKVFLKFSALIKNKIKSNDEKLAHALTDELSRLDNFLSTSPGFFLDGDDLLHPDCILLPKLHHVRIAAKHYKKYDIPENLKYLNSYLAAADKHPVFASTKPSDDAVIEGWRKHAT